MGIIVQPHRCRTWNFEFFILNVIGGDVMMLFMLLFNHWTWLMEMFLVSHLNRQLIFNLLFCVPTIYQTVSTDDHQLIWETRNREFLVHINLLFPLHWNKEGILPYRGLTWFLQIIINSIWLHGVWPRCCLV